MSLYTGVTGKIAIKRGSSLSKDLAHMANWSVELSKDMIEVVSFGDDYKEKIPSIKDWSASCDGKADFSTDGGQRELLQVFESGEAIEASFYLDAATFMVGTAYIESYTFQDAADGAVDVSVSLAGSGAILMTLPTGG